MKTLEQIASKLGMRIVAHNEPVTFSDLPDTIDLKIDGNHVRLVREAGEPIEWISDPLKVERDGETIRFEFVLIPNVRLSELHSARSQDPNKPLLRGITSVRNLDAHGRPEGLCDFLAVTVAKKPKDVTPYLQDAQKSLDKTYAEFMR